MKMFLMIFCALLLSTVFIISSCRKLDVKDQECAKIELISSAGTDDQSIYVNGSIQDIRYRISGDTTGITVFGLPIGFGYSIDTSGILTISGNVYDTTGSPFTYTVIVTRKTDNCSASATGTIHVNLCDKIALTSGYNSDTQTVRVNTEIKPITYIVTGGATGVTVTGLPPGITSHYSAGTLTISGTSTITEDGSFIYSIATTGGNCNTTHGGIISITTCATLNLSTPYTEFQWTPVNTPIKPIVYELNGATDVSAIGLPPGVTGTLLGNVYTISGTPTATLAETYRYTLSTTGGSCVATREGLIYIQAPYVDCNPSSSSVTFNWVSSTGADVYDVNYTINGGSWQSGGTISANTFTINSLNVGDIVLITIMPRLSTTGTLFNEMTETCSAH